MYSKYKAIDTFLIVFTRAVYIIILDITHIVDFWHRRHLMKATIVLLPLLGLTWLIGIISVNNATIAFAWIFTILNSLQVIV